ncbi:CD99 antigen-like protein 2 isoform X4 [Alosa sapidissima]|uniref:CD99 antigen-like protein 2 isoform X4 n=1 Tax=Alosa sapidissima TaxID=34773 RepID=UPI001C09853B|nr:CD99 antigen-like protein 2 isoform X4 [Alosa sapidissima]
MMSYLWIFLLATLVTGVKSEEGDVSEDVAEAEALPTDSTPEEAVPPEEGSPTESVPEDAAAPDEETATGSPAEEEAAVEETAAAPETSEGEEAPTEEGTVVPPAEEEAEGGTQGEADSADETAPEATEAPSPSEEEAPVEGGSDPATEETDVAIEAPVSKEEVEPVEGGFDLSDAFEPANDPPADSGPVEGKGARSAGAASGPDGAAEDKETGSGKIAGILAAVGVAIVGAASGYFAYQKKKLCFKPEADAESAHKADPATQAEPQVLSSLLSSS